VADEKCCGEAVPNPSLLTQYRVCHIISHQVAITQPWWYIK